VEVVAAEDAISEEAAVSPAPASSPTVEVGASMMTVRVEVAVRPDWSLAT